MSDRLTPQVIVGVARSTAGLAALRAAAAEAARRGVPLHAARVRSSIFGPVDDYSQIDEALEKALGGFPVGLEVRRELLAPPISQALADRAGNPGDLLFIGARGRGVSRLLHRFRSRSVVRGCLRRAQCPVVVVSADSAPPINTFISL